MRTFYKINIVVLIILCSFIYLPSKAQQEPMYTQYMFNTLNINPGYAGSREAISLYLLSRSQWIGLEGAPSSQSMAIHSPFYNDKIGIGASFTYDQIGPMKSTFINLNYAYRFRITERSQLSVGLRGGINNYSIDLTNLNITDDTDPTFTNNSYRSFLPNVGIGAYYYTHTFYVGFSIPKLFETKMINKDLGGETNLDKERRHYFIIAGYVYELSSDFKIKPTMLTKIVTGAPISVDINMAILYKERFWIGAVYRFGDALGAILQYRISENLSLGYSYDMAVSKLNSYNTGTHEIMLSFDLDYMPKGKVVTSPRYF